MVVNTKTTLFKKCFFNIDIIGKVEYNYKAY